MKLYAVISLNRASWLSALAVDAEIESGIPFQEIQGKGEVILPVRRMEGSDSLFLVETSRCNMADVVIAKDEVRRFIILPEFIAAKKRRKDNLKVAVQV